MNRKPICMGVLLCAALLSACSSAPKLKEPSGPWVDVNPAPRQPSQEATDAQSKK